MIRMKLELCTCKASLIGLQPILDLTVRPQRWVKNDSQELWKWCVTCQVQTAGKSESFSFIFIISTESLGLCGIGKVFSPFRKVGYRVLSVLRLLFPLHLLFLTQNWSVTVTSSFRSMVSFTLLAKLASFPAQWN